MTATPEQQAVVNRVKRAQGQLAGVLRMIEEDRELTAVLHQLKAVSNALDRVGFALVAAQWRDVVRTDGELSDETIGDLERLFLCLS